MCLLITQPLVLSATCTEWQLPIQLSFQSPILRQFCSSSLGTVFGAYFWATQTNCAWCFVLISVSWSLFCVGIYSDPIFRPKGIQVAGEGLAGLQKSLSKLSSFRTHHYPINWLKLGVQILWLEMNFLRFFYSLNHSFIYLTNTYLSPAAKPCVNHCRYWYEWKTSFLRSS